MLCKKGLGVLFDSQISIIRKWVVIIGRMLLPTASDANLASLAVVVVQKGLGVLCYAKRVGSAI